MILTVTANPAIDKAYFVDHFTMGEVHRPIRVIATAGGKGLNVSRVAKILGEPVTAMGFVGGSAGSFICEEVIKLGIHEAFTRINGETRTCINISDSSGTSGEILEPGPEITKTNIDIFLREYDKQLAVCDMVCVSGSLPKGVTGDFYTELIHRAKVFDKHIIVDTSGKTMIEAAEAAPFMIKPNRDELAQFLGFAPQSESDIRKALHIMQDMGIAVPLVPLGAEGAAALIDNTIYRFSSPRVTVKNTVGSGDSTVAGIAVGLCQGLSVPEAIRLGLAAGTANTQFEDTGMVSKEMVKKYFNEMRITIC